MSTRTIIRGELFPFISSCRASVMFLHNVGALVKQRADPKRLEEAFTEFGEKKNTLKFFAFEELGKQFLTEGDKYNPSV